MKLSNFTTKQEYIDYLNAMIIGYTKAVARQYTLLAKELEGYGKKEWVRLNYIPSEKADAEWKKHIEWRREYIRSIERKINKARNELAEQEG